jgi:hypothetical protein
VEVPRATRTTPPQVSIGPLSYTHRPLRGGAHGGGGRWASGRFPTNPLLVRLAKNRLTSSKNQPREPAFWRLGRNPFGFPSFAAGAQRALRGTHSATTPRQGLRATTARARDPLQALTRSLQPLPMPAPPNHSGSHRPGFRLGLPLLIYPPTVARRGARAWGQMGQRSIPDKPTFGAFG